jgi:hypothetical protein
VSKRARRAASSGETDWETEGTGVLKDESTILRRDYAGCEIDLLAMLC